MTDSYTDYTPATCKYFSLHRKAASFFHITTNYGREGNSTHVAYLSACSTEEAQHITRLLDTYLAETLALAEKIEKFTRQ